MLRHRIIPTLLLHDKGLYKTFKYSVGNGKYIGDPINAIKIFNDKFVDELIFLDIDASRKGYTPNYKIISDIASECFMPVGYGGGIKTLSEISKIFSIGIEKVILNTSILSNIVLLSDAAKLFGNQSIVASVNVKTNIFGMYKVFNSSTRKYSRYNLLDYLKLLEDQGAGEIYLSSVNRDGTYLGYDIELIKSVTSQVNIPVIVNGGARDMVDFKAAIVEGGASAVSASSMFVFNGPHKAVLITYPEYAMFEKVMES
jgi:imidazole glycerol-phosphate synthase subunit HisF